MSNMAVFKHGTGVSLVLDFEMCQVKVNERC